MAASAVFAKNIVNTDYTELPPEAIEAAKKQVLDTLGVILAGTMSENIRKFSDLVKEWGGKEESTILGYGGKVPCVNAALVNGWSSCVLDYDDFHDMDFIHASREIIPASLAMAERIGTVNGKDFITSVVLGLDMSCRIARSVQVHRGSGYLTAPNFFGAAAAAGKLLELDEEKMKNAFGLALMQLSGEGYGIREALNNKGMDNAFQARAGVLSALLADMDLSGSSEPLEDSKWGFFAICHRNNFNPALLTEDLGKTFEGSANSQKPYPCCRFNHTSIEAALALTHENDIEPDNVEEVIVHHGPIAHSLFEPLEEKQCPKNAIHTQHNLPWSVANAIVHRVVGIDNFTEEATKDRSVLEMAKKIIPKLHPDLAHVSAAEPAIVDIKTKDGKTYTKRVDAAPGSPEDPMTFEDVISKFRYCCNYSANPIPHENREKAIQMIQGLEDVTDMGEIADLLRGAA